MELKHKHDPIVANHLAELRKNIALTLTPANPSIELNKGVDNFSNVQIFTEENILKFSEDLQKAFDSEQISSDEFEKAIKDLTKLQKKTITNKDGHQQTVYIRQHEDGSEHHFKTGDKVKFTHEGKERTGLIMKLKHHEKFDKFGTAEIHDHSDKGEDGKPKVYSKSLRAIEHHKPKKEKLEGKTSDFHKSKEGKKIISLAKDLGYDDWAKMASDGEISEDQMKHRMASYEEEQKHESSKSEVEKHKLYSDADYDYLKSKGWNDEKIKSRWDGEEKLGKSEPTTGNKYAEKGEYDDKGKRTEKGNKLKKLSEDYKKVATENPKMTHEEIVKKMGSEAKHVDKSLERHGVDKRGAKSIFSEPQPHNASSEESKTKKKVEKSITDQDLQKSNIVEVEGVKLEIYTEKALAEYSVNLQKSLDEGSSSEEWFEKAVKDLTQLEKKVITNKDGFQQTVYVRVHDDGSEHHFKHGDEVKFTHGGKDIVGNIKGLKSHEKFDKFGTAEVHDNDGNKYSKSLRQIEHTVTPSIEEPKAAPLDTTKKVDIKPVVKEDKTTESKSSGTGKLSENGENFIKGFEGVRLKAYQDSAGIWTIGWGSTKYEDGTPVKKGDTLADKSAADKLYKHTLKEYVDKVNKQVKVPLTQNQRDALISFKYNAGPDSGKTLFEKLNKKDYKGAADEFLKWNKITDPKTKKKVEAKGLTNRRTKERELFLKPDNGDITKATKETTPAKTVESTDTTEVKPKLSGIDAINKKQQQLSTVEEQIKNHEKGVKKMSDEDHSNAKEKVKLLKKVIQQLSDKIKD